MASHNKLVRDRIPEIIAANGGRAETRILPDDEYTASLREKLGEEAREVARAASPEELTLELADVLEVVRAIAAIHGIALGHLEAVRRERARTRGAFQRKIMLIATDGEGQ